jgi:hypothetical protein
MQLTWLMFVVEKGLLEGWGNTVDNRDTALKLIEKFLYIMQRSAGQGNHGK